MGYRWQGDCHVSTIASLKCFFSHTQGTETNLLKLMGVNIFTSGISVKKVVVRQIAWFYYSTWTTLHPSIPTVAIPVATVYRCFNVIKTGPPLKAGVLFFMRVRATCKLSLQVRWTVKKNFTVDQGNRIWSNALGRIHFFFRCAYSSGAASGFFLMFYPKLLFFFVLKQAWCKKYVLYDTTIIN